MKAYMYTVNPLREDIDNSLHPLLAIFRLSRLARTFFPLSHTLSIELESLGCVLHTVVLVKSNKLRTDLGGRTYHSE